MLLNLHQHDTRSAYCLDIHPNVLEHIYHLTLFSLRTIFVPICGIEYNFQISFLLKTSEALLLERRENHPTYHIWMGICKIHQWHFLQLWHTFYLNWKLIFIKSCYMLRNLAINYIIVMIRFLPFEQSTSVILERYKSRMRHICAIISIVSIWATIMLWYLSYIQSSIEEHVHVQKSKRWC